MEMNTHTEDAEMVLMMEEALSRIRSRENKADAQMQRIEERLADRQRERIRQRVTV